MVVQIRSEPSASITPTPLPQKATKKENHGDKPWGKAQGNDWSSLPPNMSLGEHAGQVASPITSRPSHALLQKLGVVFQRGLHLALGMILHVRLPAVRNYPSSDEIVVIRIQPVLAPTPCFVGEFIGEIIVSQNFGAVGGRTARHARYTTVHECRCRAIKVPPF